MPPSNTPDDAELSRQQLVRWFLRRQNPSGWSPKDEQAFQQWLDAAPGARQTYARWEADWQLMDDLPQEATARLRAQVASDRAIALAATPSQEPIGASVPRPKPAPRYPDFGQPLGQPLAHAPARRSFVKAAISATTMAGITAGTSLIGWHLWQAQPVYQQAMQTQRGQQRNEELPDGTLLQLDTSTTLQATYYRNRREIALNQGQAAFSVSADQGKPFQVTAGNVRVTVTGTRFSVRHTPGLPGREGVEVVVQEGAVQVAQGQRNANGEWQSQPGRSAYALKAGQQITLGAGIAEPQVIATPTREFATWRQQRISFSNTPLQQAINELERYADTGITVIDPRVAQLRLSGTFNPSDAATTRKLLQGALPIRLHQQGRGYVVAPR